MLRRDGRLFLHSLITIAVLLLLLTAGCFGAAFVIAASEAPEDARLEVAVCNLDADSNFGSLTLNFVADQELVSSLLTVVEYETQEEAVAAVRRGAAAAIVIPDGFFSGVRQGEALPCLLILGKDSESARVLIESYVTAAGDLLTAAQEGIFTGDYYLVDVGADSEAAQSVNLYMNLAILREINAAQATYLRTSSLGYTQSGLGRLPHYLVLYLAFLLSVLTVGYVRLYQADADRSHLSFLCACGIDRRSFLRWKVLLPFVLSLLLCSALCAAAQQWFGTALSLSAASILCSAAALGLMALWGVLAGFGLGASAGAVVFLVQTAGLFFCGGIIPYAKLLPAVLLIGDFTPLGCLYRLLSPLFGGTCTVSVLLPALVYTLIGILLYRRRFIGLLTGREGA